MIDSILRGLRQPEYVHVLLNPLPVYGLLISWLGLIIAVFLKSRRAQVATLVLVLVSSLSAWPVYEFGQQAYDRVLSMTDEVDAYLGLGMLQSSPDSGVSSDEALRAFQEAVRVAPDRLDGRWTWLRD